jgi:O-antigen ligase
VAVGYYQFITDSGNHGTDGFNRLEGTFTHPAPYAFFLVGLLPIAFMYFRHTTSKIARVGLVALIPAMIFCIYSSQTRGAWVGLAVLAIVLLAVRARWAVILVPLVGIALFAAVPSVQARFDEAGSSTGSVVWRQHQWERALEVASPVQIVTVGAGLRAVDAELGELAHNEYIRLLTETGIAGLAAVLLINLSLLRIAIRGYRNASTPFQRDLVLGFIMAFAARAITAFADNILIYPVLEWYFWAFAGLIVVTSGAYQRGRAPALRSAAMRKEAKAAA